MVTLSYKTRSSFFLFLLTTFQVFLSSAFADGSCAIPQAPKVIEQVTASAGKWANLRNNPGSVRFESDRLLTRGYGLLTSPDQKEKLEVLRLESAPAKRLSSYGDYQHCQQKLEETSKAPIMFTDLKFSSAKELTSWFGDFSQGSGKEGKKMYSLCDASCSPQFALDIMQADSGIKADATVICGHARDKDDDTYVIKILAKWPNCKPEN